eukprot:COSAG04_NODE_8922_length_917_cov_0.903423_1_plen_113_part_00
MRWVGNMLGLTEAEPGRAETPPAPVLAEAPRRQRESRSRVEVLARHALRHGELGASGVWRGTFVELGEVGGRLQLGAWCRARERRRWGHSVCERGMRSRIDDRSARSSMIAF